MANFNVFFTCAESPSGDYIQVEAESAQGAEDKAHDYEAFHDLHNFKVDTVAPV